jgi:hypothetical protein
MLNVAFWIGIRFMQGLGREIRTLLVTLSPMFQEQRILWLRLNVQQDCVIIVVRSDIQDFAPRALLQIDNTQSIDNGPEEQSNTLHTNLPSSKGNPLGMFSDRDLDNRVT